MVSRKERKRPRIAKRSPSPQIPLGGGPNKGKGRLPAPKTEEELELEEAVFGKAGPSTTGLDRKVGESHGLPEILPWNQGEEGEDDAGLGDMGQMQDDQLFFIDAPTVGKANADTNEPDGDEEDSDEDNTNEPPTSAPNHLLSKPRNKAAAAWIDPSDSTASVSLVHGPSRLRKLRDSQADDLVSGAEYESRLRRQFERLQPSPAWIAQARKLKRRERDGSDDENGAEFGSLLRSTGVLTSSGRRRGDRLPAGNLDVERLRDANQADPARSALSAVAFHPSAQVLLTASSVSRKLSLFRIDGSRNPVIQTLHIPDLPISAASFSPSGSSVFIGGTRPYFYAFDLQANRCIKSPRGLFNSGLGGSDGGAFSGAQLDKFRFSPSGDLVALAGRRGYVHLLDWSNNGHGGQVIGHVKMNSPVAGLAFQQGGKQLLTIGEDAEAYVWDLGTRRCIDKWRDEGGFAPCQLEVEGGGRYTAVGSKSGIVNLYDNTEESSDTEAEVGRERKTMKVVENLTTAVSTMRFNHDGQVLALASRAKKDRLKLVHLPTGSVFANWPTSGTPLGHVTAVDFSRGSEYLAIGNSKGRVLLYSLGWWSKPRK